MNLPNLLSLSRVVAVFVVAGLLMAGGQTANLVALIVFIVAAVTDFFDGWVARTFNQVTTVGKFLDALVDKIFVLGVLVALIGTHTIDELWVGVTLLLGTLVILVREFTVTGLRLIAAKRAIALAAENGGKLKTAIQMISVGLFLLANLPLADPLPLHPIATGLFLVAVIQTILSGLTYFRKYGHLLSSRSQD